jgi:predicted N-acyltransferase
LPALNAALEVLATGSKAHMIVWKDMPDAAAVDLRAYAKQARLFEVPSFPGTVVRRPGTSFETYLATLTAKKRYALKKKLSNSRAGFDLTCEVVRSPDAATLDEVWALFQQTYNKATVRFEKLTPAFFANIADDDCVHYILLRERGSGRLMAFMLCFFDRERAINKFIGIDYEAGNQAFLYFRLWEEFVRWATAGGASELQSGQTSYSAKFDLGHELVPLSNFSRHLSAPLNAIYAFVGRYITWSTLDDDLKVHVAAQARKDALSRRAA